MDWLKQIPEPNPFVSIAAAPLPDGRLQARPSATAATIRVAVTWRAELPIQEVKSGGRLL